MIKLVVSDIDGTLVKDGHHTLNPRINEVILELKKKGILFVAASGRQYPSMKRLFRDVKDEVIFIADNGAYIVVRGTELDEQYMEIQVVEGLVKEIRELEGCFLTVSTRDKLYIESHDDDFLDLLVNGYRNDVEVVEDVLSLDLHMLNVSIYKEDGIDDVAKVMEAKWQDKFQVNIAGGRWLDFMDPKVDKGHALGKIQQALNVKPSETMAFGDNINDLGMMKMAEESYAVANAREEVKAVAKHIADTNLNDGVLKVLETLL